MSDYLDKLINSSEQGEANDVFGKDAEGTSESFIPSSTPFPDGFEAVEAEEARPILGNVVGIGAELGTGLYLTKKLHKSQQFLKWANKAKTAAVVGMAAPEPASSVGGVLTFAAAEAAIWGTGNLIGQNIRKAYGVQDNVSAGEVLASSVFGVGLMTKAGQKLISMGDGLASMKAWGKGNELFIAGTKSFVSGATLGVAETALRQEVQIMLNERENRDVMEYLIGGAAGGGFNTMFDVFSRTGKWGQAKAKMVTRKAKESLAKKDDELEARAKTLPRRSRGKLLKEARQIRKAIEVTDDLGQQLDASSEALNNPKPKQEEAPEAPAEPTSVKQWFHASHKNIEKLTPREVDTVDTFGTWVSGSSDTARMLYGPNVKQADATPKNLLEAHTDNFGDFFFSNENLFKKLFPNEDVSLLKKFDEAGLKKSDPKVWEMRKAYLTEFRKMLQDAGHDGVIFKDSRIDLSKADSPHDVAVLFNDADIPLNKPKEAPAEPTPAPKTDAEIEAMSDDELLSELGVDKPKEGVPAGSFRSELDGNIYTKKAELEDGVSIESGRIADDGDLNNLPEGLRKVLEPVKDKIQRLNITIGKNGLGLDTIVVQKSSRGKGVGAQIIKDIIAYADSQNLPIVLTPSNRNAAKLDDYYKRLGFVDNKDGLGKQKLIRKPASVEDPIDDSIKAINAILTGDRTGGEGARVTRRVKRHFRVVAKEFMGDINDLLKNKDIETAKKILGRIDKYIEFDRAVSKKDYAQGSELQANSRNAMDNGTTDYAAGITAAGNKRTEDLNVLKGMLQKLVDEDVAIDPKVAKQVAKDAKKNAEGAPKLSKEEKLDAIADQVAKTFTGERTGVFQQAIDGYFTVRLTQMLNQAKTAFVGVPSATFMSVVRPIINTPYNVRKSLSLEGVTLSRRLQYAAADISATYEYVRMITKHLGDTLRSSRDTILNKGDSNFLYRDRNAYIKDQLAEANEVSHVVKRRLKQAQRREAARNAKTETGRRILNAKATVMNSKIAQVPAFFFDYGVSLIGGLEEISLIAHSMRAARAQGIKKGIDEGVDDVWKFSEEYMESAFDRSRGSLQAKYDPEFADIFNTARRDHFRAMDLDPNDIRKDMVDGLIAGLNKVSNNPDEMGLLARTLFVFIGVPMRALGANVSYIASPANVTKNIAGGLARRGEQALGGTATFGKYNKKISELELDIKEQKTLLKSQDADVAKTAEKKLAELEDSLALTKDLKMQKDYEDLGKLAVGTGLFFLGYEMAKNGQVAGTDSWMTEEQKLAAQKVQGAPNSWKVVLGGSEYDFKYFEPLKGVFALGADYARRQIAEEAGSLTDDQTMTQFFTSVTKSIATDSPFATGARYMTQIMSPNPDTQERGVMGVVRSLVPVPAEVRNFSKFDEEFVTDTTSGEFADTILSASLGQETGNYRLTVLGEPKLKEEPSIASYLIPFGPKTVPEREPIDDILLEDAMSFRSVSSPQTSISGFKLKNYVNSDNETLYSLYGRLITETKIGGKSQRQALNALVKTSAFKRAYKEGYVMNEQGTEVNEGIEMIKEIISEYRAVARDKILNTKSASEYTDSDGNNIYDVLKEREQFSERPESLLENLNLK